MSNIRWAFNISKWNPTKKDIILATRCLQPEEKERIGKFYFQNDFKSSLVGRLMLRKYVSENTDVSYEKIRILRDEKQKPFLPDENLKFNVSHQGDYVVCAGFKNTSPIGIDVMSLELREGKNLEEFFRLMRRQFSSYEWETINNKATSREQVAMFYRHWCLKESYVKAIGVGITVDLRDISFKINTDNLRVNDVVSDTELFVQGEKLQWEFQETLLDERHCVAIALSGNSNEIIKFKELNFEELMINSQALLDEDLEYCNNFFKKPLKPI